MEQFITGYEVENNKKHAFDDSKIEDFQKRIFEKVKNKDFEIGPDTFVEYLNEIGKQNKH